MDFSKFDLTVSGKTQTNLSKRALVYEVVKACLAQGIPAREISNHIPPNKWLSVEGTINAAEFRAKASQLQGKLGASYNLRRYFSEDGELFHGDGRTFALSNQWSIASLPLVDELIALLTTGTVSYRKAPVE